MAKQIPHALTVSIHDRARNAFFANYVRGYSNKYDVLGSLYKGPAPDEHLVASVDTVSLALFTFQGHHPQASKLARAKYIHALPLLNNALKSPKAATSDSTLLAVLLLDLFEKITNNVPRSTSSWMSHVNGALALVKMRNPDQIQNYTALRLSVRLTTSLLISCVAANAPVPPELAKLREDLAPFLTADDPKWQVSGLVVKYANLQGAIQDGYLCASDILTRTVELDGEFISLTRNLPASWLYNTTYLFEPSQRVYEEHFDTYSDHFVTQTWNVLRVMRVLLNNIIRTYSPSRNSGMVTSTIDSIAKDICASVPQYTGSKDYTPSGTDSSTAQMLRCYALLFPLYVAGLYASASSGIKAWTIKQLRFMANQFGIRNANVVTEILERDEGTSPWDVYAMLGSYAFAA